MLDPVTVIATASAAYNALKKGIEIGRELQDMGGQLATWAGAISDIDYLAKKAENPPWWKVGGNVQAEAIEIFAAKKKIEAQRAELKTYIQYSYGQSGWDELMRIEAQVRKRKQATDHRKSRDQGDDDHGDDCRPCPHGWRRGSGSACLFSGAATILAVQLNFWRKP
jgi:hypothetical protein